MGRMQDKVTIITGGGSGMGQASVRVFGDEGAIVVVADINEAAGQAMADELTAKGQEAMFVKVDISSEESTAAMAKTVMDKYGRIDSLVNFAAAGGSAHSDTFMVYGKLWEFDLASWEKMLRINLTGTFLITKAVVPYMIEAKSGSIVYVSSLNGLQGIQNADAYTATKGGICALTRVMAANVGDYNIRVNCLCPGVVATPQHGEGWEQMIGKPMNGIGLSVKTPINRVGLAVEQAQAALWLASDDASFVTGVNLPVDGGWNAI